MALLSHTLITAQPLSVNMMLWCMLVSAVAKCGVMPPLLVALLSSVACELAQLRIVLLCVFFTYFYFSFYMCNVWNDYV